MRITCRTCKTVMSGLASHCGICESACKMCSMPIGAHWKNALAMCLLAANTTQAKNLIAKEDNDARREREAAESIDNDEFSQDCGEANADYEDRCLAREA